MELLIDGKTVFIDDEDAIYLGNRTWRITKTRLPYLSATTSDYIGVINGKRKTHKRYIFFHRLATKCISGMCVDHINGNTLDNRKCNLRVCTNKQNHMNTSIPIHNTSGYKGVSYDKERNNWQAYISINNKKVFIGRYKTPKEAHDAYCEYGLNARGEYFSIR